MLHRVDGEELRRDVSQSLLGAPSLPDSAFPLPGAIERHRVQRFPRQHGADAPVGTEQPVQKRGSRALQPGDDQHPTGVDGVDFGMLVEKRAGAQTRHERIHDTLVNDRPPQGIQARFFVDGGYQDFKRRAEFLLAEALQARSPLSCKDHALRVQIRKEPQSAERRARPIEGTHGPGRSRKAELRQGSERRQS